ncbi:phage antirepressor [Enterococcus faecium]|uniref:phage antirepressor KilAC domain-containing protein n=1 Tax=Enterococcus faecium TaxID=1352 RepID=UPI000C280888|nr:phage antirepressor [Enterococcus faecium]EME8113399.1 phage antirepressor [Enterococcus faecium]MDB7483893.1 phage antirepressor [Enterococcus faecium]MDB7489023.1 phage antirepressor [Enterococcus faecium]MDB7491447.1 phage antirepressor [Enterococcus faecium]MDB7493992.1 phage antirepressor [Enterococcus faecium]
MNTPQIFNFEQNEVRTVLVNDEPYFVGKDVASVLGYSNTKDALSRHVDLEDKMGSRITTSGQSREMTIINESGLYSLILKSKLPNAKKFKRWVTSEVLPQIRKHGMYATDELLNNPDLLIEVATKLKEERTQRLIAEQRVNELQPKADYYDRILNNKGLVTVSTIAKNYGMSAVSFNKLLHELGIQFNQSGTWLLYSKFQDKGYTHIEPFDYEDKNGNRQVKTRMKWTQKGHIFLYETLKKNNYLPMIEREQTA